MILIDANVLLYSVDRESPDHKKAKIWLESTLLGPSAVGFAWMTILAVLRLTTRPGLGNKQLSVAQAFKLVDNWLERPVSIVLHPGNRHRQILRDLLTVKWHRRQSHLGRSPGSTGNRARSGDLHR
jgi:predicted nucleic acid-binding protein